MGMKILIELFFGLANCCRCFNNNWESRQLYCMFFNRQCNGFKMFV